MSVAKSSQAACPSKRLNNRIKDNAVADSLAERLGTDGMKVWLGESVLQPGGSIRDEEVIAACDEAGVVLVMTGRRHFRH